MASEDAVEPTKPTIAAVARPGTSTATIVDTSTLTRAKIEIVSGAERLSRAPMVLPTKPPTPAAPPTTPSSSSWVNALCCGAGYWLFTTKAMNSARNPVSTRIMLFAHSVAMTICGKPFFRVPLPTSLTGTSPSVDSTQAGIRRHSTPPRDRAGRGEEQRAR